jgi:hypothetical protein
MQFFFVIFSLKDVVRFFFVVKGFFLDLALLLRHATRIFSNLSRLPLLTVQWQCAVLRQRCVCVCVCLHCFSLVEMEYRMYKDLNFAQLLYRVYKKVNKFEIHLNKLLMYMLVL